MKKAYITPEIETVKMVVESKLMTTSINGATPGEGDGTDMNSQQRITIWGDDEEY